MITNYLNRLADWAKSQVQRQNPLLMLPLLVLVVVVIICPLASIISLAAFYFPWVPGIAIPVCLCAFVFLLILGVVVRKRRYQIWNTAIKFFIIPVAFWISTFVFVFVSDYMSDAIGLRMVSSVARFPLSDIRTITVDSKGRIYCLSRPYNRVQIFDSDGSFLIGWFVGIPGGSDWRLLIDKADNLIVAIEYKNKKISFDSKGNLISEEAIFDFDKEFGSEKPEEIRDSLGNIYKPRPLGRPVRVVKVATTGEEVVVVKEAFTLWLLKPSRGLLFFAPGCLICSFILISMKKKETSKCKNQTID